MGTKRKKQPRWRYTAGKRPYRVTVYERTPGGVIYGRVWDPVEQRIIKRSLGHRDRDRAVAYADREAGKLRDGASDLRQGTVTLGMVLELYLRHRSPQKRKKAQGTDARQAALWRRYLGPGTDPHRISLREWEAFIADRTSGAIDARGRRVADRDRRPVGPRTVAADLGFLGSVFRWAVRWRTPQGHYLLREDPTRGLPVPREKNPRRPIATRDRYEALRAVSDRVTTEAHQDGRRVEVRSHLSELLDLAVGTGRRIGAISALRFEDLRLGDGTPHGSITWPADTDKMGRSSTVPIGPDVRAALDRIMAERPGIGAAPLFPAPREADEPVSRFMALKWLRECERLAGLEHVPGGGWHAFRRLWATERKHLPAQDVARAGGWKTAAMVSELYTQADSATTLNVVLNHGELREAK